VTAEVILDIAEAGEDAWLDARLQGITGSDCLAALGADPQRSRTSLWVEKVHGITREFADDEPLAMGHILEPAVRAGFTYKTGLQVRPANVLLRSERWPWMLASPDGFVIADGDPIFEAKTTMSWRKHEWADDGIPDKALAQTMHYLAVVGAPRAYIAVLIDNRVQWREIERDDALIEDIAELERRFWHEHVLTREMPPIDDAGDSTADALTALFPEHVGGKGVELEGDVREAWEQWLAAKAAKKVAAEAEDLLSNRLRAYLGDAEQGLVDGVPRVSWKASTRKALDQTAIKAAHPALVAEFMNETPVRTLRALAAPKAKTTKDMGTT
jgi:putative phage-type endonuclease